MQTMQSHGVYLFITLSALSLSVFKSLGFWNCFMLTSSGVESGSKYEQLEEFPCLVSEENIDSWT